MSLSAWYVSSGPRNESTLREVGDVRADGSAIERYLVHPFTVAECSGKNCWADACSPFALDAMAGYTALAVHDWDDDGVSEIALDAWTRLSMGRGVLRVLVLDDDGQHLRHLPATLSLTIVGLRDADSDGRLSVP